MDPKTKWPSVSPSLQQYHFNLLKEFYLLLGVCYAPHLARQQRSQRKLQNSSNAKKKLFLIICEFTFYYITLNFKKKLTKIVLYYDFEDKKNTTKHSGIPTLILSG